MPTIKKGELVKAEKEFQRRTESEPQRRARRLAGLGLVRLRQQRFGEARDFFSAR